MYRLIRLLPLLCALLPFLAAAQVPSPNVKNLSVVGPAGFIEMNTWPVSFGGWASTARPTPSSGKVAFGFNTTLHAFEWSSDGVTWSPIGGSGGMTGPTTSVVGKVPLWDNTTGSKLAAGLPVGAGATALLQLDGAGLIPAAVMRPCSTSGVGAVPATGGGTVNFLRADCTFAAVPSAQWSAGAVTSLGTGLTNVAGVLAASGTGGVSGPGSSTLGHRAVWGGTGGDALIDSAGPYIDAAAEFGVVCDGSTDRTTAIQAALNAVTATRRTVVLPGGVCLYSRLTITINGTQLIGQGGNDGFDGVGTQLNTTTTTGNALTVGQSSTGVNGVRIKGIHFDATGARSSGAMIYRYAASWVVFEDIDVEHGYVGIFLDGTCGSGNCSYDNWIKHSHIGHNDYAGIIIGASGNTTSVGFLQNEFFVDLDVSVNGAIGGAPGGIEVVNCGGCNFVNVQGILNRTGMLLQPGNNQTAVLGGNLLAWDSSIDAGVSFHATGSGTIVANLSNVWASSTGTGGGFYNNPAAIGIVFNSPSTAYVKVDISGGQIYNNAAHGVWEAQATRYVTFTGVSIFDNSAYFAGAPACPTATPVCNNGGQYDNYSMSAGTTHFTATGGHWGGVATGLVNLARFAINQGAGVVDYVSLAGLDVSGTQNTGGSCSMGGVTYTGGVSCASGGSNSKLTGLVGESGGGGGGGGVITGTSGVLGNVVVCGNSGCTTIAGSGVTISGSNVNAPAGMSLGSAGFPFASLFLSSPLATAQGGTGTTFGAARPGANSDITSLTGLTTPLGAAYGGTGGTGGAATPGANSNISSLSGLTTPLSVGQGGTGSTSGAGARSAIGAAASGSNGDITGMSGLTNVPFGVTDGVGNRLVTQAFSGSSSGTLVGCANGGCSQIAGTGFGLSNIEIYPLGDNSAALGDGAHRWTVVYATTGSINTSDARLKQDIANETLGLDFIDRLRPVSYRWRDAAKPELAGVHHGLIAQEVDRSLEGAAFAGLHHPDDANPYYGINYDEMVSPLVLSIQQLNARIIYVERVAAFVAILLLIAAMAACLVMYRVGMRRVHSEGHT